MYKYVSFGLSILLSMTLRLASAQADVPTMSLKSQTDSLQTRLHFENINHKLVAAIDEFNGNVDSLKKNQDDVGLYLIAVQKQYGKLLERLNNLDSASAFATERIHKIDSLISKKKSRIDSLLQSNRLNSVSSLNLSHLDEKISKADINTKGPSVDLSNNFNVPPLRIDIDPENYIPTPIDTNDKLLQTKLEKTSESFIKSIDEVKKIESSHQEVKSFTKQAEEHAKALQDVEALKLKAKEEFIDHFEGKEEIIKKDIEDIAQLQTKYRDITDSRLLPKYKWKMNGMKGKPFIERVIPGIDLQVFTGTNISVHAAPWISYKISGTFQAGISAFGRLTYLKKEESLRLADSYGFRFFTLAKIFKSVNVFAEFERYKPDPDSPPIFTSKMTQQVNDVGFTSKVNLGLMNNYSLGKNIRGYFMVLYDVLQIKRFPNSVGSSVRFGFQYELKAKKKQ